MPLNAAIAAVSRGSSLQATIASLVQCCSLGSRSATCSTLPSAARAASRTTSSLSSLRCCRTDSCSRRPGCSSQLLKYRDKLYSAAGGCTSHCCSSSHFCCVHSHTVMLLMASRAAFLHLLHTAPHTTSCCCGLTCCNTLTRHGVSSLSMGDCGKGMKEDHALRCCQESPMTALSLLVEVGMVWTWCSNQSGTQAAQIISDWVFRQEGIPDFTCLRVIRNMGHTEAAQIVKILKYQKGGESPVRKVMHICGRISINILCLSWLQQSRTCTQSFPV